MAARSSRPLGHDVIVTALLVMSCSEHHEKELSRDIAVKVDAPVAARVMRVTVEATDSAGCGCTSPTGGRGGIPLPSCSQTHCAAQRHEQTRCELEVEREGVVAKLPVHCGPKGETALELDQRGERFAVFSGHAWFVSAGGWSGALAGGVPSDKVKVVVTGPTMDWSAVASAREILMADLSYALGQGLLQDGARRKRDSALLEGLGHVAPEHLAEDLIALVPKDWHVRACPTGRTPWLDFLSRQPPEVQNDVKERLALGLRGTDQPMIEHAIRALEPREMLARVPGSPADFIERGPKSAMAAAAVLDAWSKTAPAAAAAYACQLLPKAVEPYVANASYAAIARTGHKCDAVRWRKPHWCARHWDISPHDLERDRPDAAADLDQLTFCEPARAFVLASRAQNARFDRTQLEALCDADAGNSMKTKNDE